MVGLLLRDPAERLLIVVSAWHDPLPFTLPKDEARRWRLRVDAGRGLIDPPDRTFGGGDTVDLEGRSLLLFSGEEG